MSKLPPKAVGKPTSGCDRQKPSSPANVSQNTVIDKQAKGNLIPMRFRPYEERMQNYLGVKNHIFQDKDPQIHRRTNRLKAYYAEVKRNKKIQFSTIFNNSTDLRSYAEASFLQYKELGLLDTGANISCIGAELALQDFSNFFGIQALKVASENSRRGKASYDRFP